MNLEVISHSPAETLSLGKNLAGTLTGVELILLSGDLGAGKTLFSKGLASGLGIDPQQVVSPTFTLMNQYRGNYLVSHIDLYRIGESLSGNVPEIDEYLGSGIVLVEWAQYLDKSYFQLSDTIAVEITVLPKDDRLFSFQGIAQRLDEKISP